MSEPRLADALSRLDRHHALHLPLRRGDLVGRLALRLLWRRHLKWQVETNLATRDAVAALRDVVAGLEQAQRDTRDEVARRTEGLVSTEDFNHQVAMLQRSDQNITAGTTQRLYSAVGQVQTQLSELRLELTEKAEDTTGAQQRIKDLEARVAGLLAADRDARLRHAQLDLFLDEIRAGLPERPDRRVAESAPDRAAFLEPAVSALVDGPAEAVREQREGHLPVLRAALAAGAAGPVLDMSPGRGEWCQVLRSAGIDYRSASTNPAVRGRLAEAGCEIEDRDPLDALAGAPRGALGAITAFRWVERQAPTGLAGFVDMAVLALAPGGVLVVETPAPTAAGQARLHLDPFARRLVHPDFLRFLVEAAGFAAVEVHHPVPGDPRGWSADPGAAAGADRYRLVARR